MKPDDLVLQLTLAAVYALDNQSDKAEQILMRVPNDPIVRAHYHVILADAHRSRSDGQSAIREYGKALAIAPNTPGLNYRLGALHSDLNDVEKAMKLFKRELEVNPQNPDAHFSLGAYSLNFQNQLDTARRHFQRSVELNPQHLEAYLGLMKTSLAQGKPAEALQLAERIQSVGQENGELHYLKARALNLLGKKDQAESELKLFELWREDVQ
jgi:tetratricopeptide (TPR) repeat protein